MSDITATLNEVLKGAEEAYQMEEFGLAAEQYAAAAGLYEQDGNTLQAAEMRNNRSVALLRKGDARGALEAASGTDPIFAAAGDFRRQAIALANQAAALEALKQYDQADPLYRQAADLFKQVGEMEMRATVLKSLSMMQFHQGKRIVALASMRNALEAQKKLTLRERVLKSLLGVVFRLAGGQ